MFLQTPFAWRKRSTPSNARTHSATPLRARYGKALEIYDEILAKNPKDANPTVRLFKACCLFALGKQQEATECAAGVQTLRTVRILLRVGRLLRAF